jgi:hypothetical protein
VDLWVLPSSRFALFGPSSCKRSNRFGVAIAAAVVACCWAQMWLFVVGWVLRHIGGGEVFGPGVWFVTNDCMWFGAMLVLLPRQFPPKPLDADAASDSFVRATGACFVAVGWAVAQFLCEDGHALAPLGDLGQQAVMVLQASDAELAETAVPSRVARALVASTLLAHLVVLGTLGIRGVRRPRARVERFAPPLNRGNPQLEEWEATLQPGETLPVSVLGQCVRGGGGGHRQKPHPPHHPRSTPAAPLLRSACRDHCNDKQPLGALLLLRLASWWWRCCCVRALPTLPALCDVSRVISDLNKTCFVAFNTSGCVCVCMRASAILLLCLRWPVNGRRYKTLTVRMYVSACVVVLIRRHTYIHHAKS